jgi:hypothetical protein
VDQKADLEEFLGSMRQREEAAIAGASDAQAARNRAEAAAAAARAAQASAEAAAEELGCKCRLLQESAKSMRQECTERWVGGQAIAQSLPPCNCH